MKIKLLITLITAAGLFHTGCEYDNFEAPQSSLSGRVVYNNAPVGVRTNGNQLELWQDGHKLRTLIPVYISHDGFFSANLFDGSYKLVRKGNAPWLQQATDTILVEVKGNTKLDVPVTPYFTVGNESFTIANNTVTANFTVNKIVATANVDAVRLYLGKYMLTDEGRNEVRISANVGSMVLGANSTLTAQIPDNLKSLPYVFARIGVKSTSSGEYYYTQIQKITLNN